MVTRGHLVTRVLLVSLTVLVWEKSGCFRFPRQTASFRDFRVGRQSENRKAGASERVCVTGEAGRGPGQRARCGSVVPRLWVARHRQPVSTLVRFPEEKTLCFLKGKQVISIYLLLGGGRTLRKEEEESERAAEMLGQPVLTVWVDLWETGHCSGRSLTSSLPCPLQPCPLGPTVADRTRADAMPAGASVGPGRVLVFCVSVRTMETGSGEPPAQGARDTLGPTQTPTTLPSTA